MPRTVFLRPILFRVTVLEVIQRSAEFLAKKGVETPRLQAELLLAHVLKLPRMQLYLNFDRALTPVEQDALRELVKRRGQREPLQHIVGSTSFCGLEMAVDRNVLIPRPETELLAEQGWIFLGQLSAVYIEESGGTPSIMAEHERRLSVLDFGTGSGCVAIALAVRCATAQVVALDIVPEALEMARENAARHGVLERIRFVLGNGLSALPRAQAFDLIVANPPYIATVELNELQPEVRDYDPPRALDGGPDGLDFYRHLAAEAGCFLRTGGKIMLEFGDGQEERVADLFRSENWIVERVVEDYTQRPRILIAQKDPNPARPN
jgi:release factor glutamine methyltransferase